MAADTNQKRLKKFINRRHPEFEEKSSHWEFLESTYNGGRDWFESNIFQYIKEGEDEFSDRKERAYRFNHTREVVDLLNKYLFKMEIKRNDKDAPESVKQFWKQATLNKASIDDFAKQMSTKTSIFGRGWLVVDATKVEGVRTRAEEKAAGARTYAYIVPPQHALDMSYDELGELQWILIYELGRDDEDPINSSGELEERYRLWTKTGSTLFTVETDGKKVTIVQHEEVAHELGVVPVIPMDNQISDALYSSPALIADVAYLDRAVANYLSNLDAIIQDQTFSQLAMPAQGLLPGEDGYEKLVEMGTKRLFTFDGESGATPFFLSPDVKQAELILKVVNKIINEIYHTVGLAGERTKEDNAMGIDNSSGVAKAYDFERVNSLLAAKADSLEMVEKKLAWMVAKYSGEEEQVEKIMEDLIHYPDNFDVRGLYDEFEIAARLALVEAPDSVRRHQMDSVIEKLFPQLSEDLKKEMASELKTWPPKVDPLTAPGKSGTDTIRASGRSTLANTLAKE